MSVDSKFCRFGRAVGTQYRYYITYLRHETEHSLVRIAPALLLQGKIEAALQEYRKGKDAPFVKQHQTFFKDAFLKDLRQFEEVGIIPEVRKADVAAVRKLLEE